MRREINIKKVNTRSIIRTFLDSKLASILSWISLYFEKAMSQKRKKKTTTQIMFSAKLPPEKTRKMIIDFFSVFTLGLKVLL